MHKNGDTIQNFPFVILLREYIKIFVLLKITVYMNSDTTQNILVKIYILICIFLYYFQNWHKSGSAQTASNIISSILGYSDTNQNIPVLIKIN